MSATLAFLPRLIWLIVANVLGMLPSRDQNWSNAYRLTAVGLPILIWIAVAKGLIWAALFLLAAANVLRWPLAHVWRWMKTRLG